MKRFLVLATVAASIMSGCSKFVDDKVLDASGAINFDTYMDRSNTDGTKGVAKGGFVMGDQFFVYGGKTGTAAFDVSAPNNNEWVYKGADFPDFGAKVSNYGNDVWRYDKAAPWDASLVTFFAFSPVPDKAVGGETYGITMTSPAINTIPAIDFVVKGGYDPAETISSAAANTARAENKKQVDLLWALAKDKGRIDRTVDLMFSHALTRLNFSVCSKAPVGHMIRINTIAVKNVFTKGKLALAHDETSAPKPGDMAYLGGWSAPSEVKNFPVNIKNSVAALIKDNAVHAINDADEALMMIPQELTNVVLEVCYSHSADGITWENYQSGTPVIVELGSLSSHTHWNPNRSIRYTLNITPGEVIAFTAGIENWGTEGNIVFINENPSKNAATLQTLTLNAGDTFSALTGGWITYDDGTGAKPLTTTEVVAIAGSYKFEVLANNTPAVREDQIIIKSADGNNQTIIKVAQASSDGIFSVTEAAGDVTTLDLKAGDKVAVPQTKADAAWVKYKVGAGAPTAFAGEYTAAADEKFTLTVEANTGAARASVVVFTPSTGSAITYTIKQAAGIAVPPTELELAMKAVAKQALAGVDQDVIVLSTGGGAWLTITDDGGARALASGTAAGAYTINVEMNNTTSARTAEFTVTTGSVTKSYKLTQAAATTQAIAVAVDGTPEGTVTLAIGDKIVKNAAASSWLTMDSPEGSVAGYAFEVDQTVDATTAGAWVLKAGVNADSAAKTETFTVVTTAEEVVVYTITQAGA